MNSSNLLIIKSKSILFVEDDAMTRIQITNMLKMLFHRVFCAKDGEEAYNLYEDECPDIILTDVRMPKKDGIKLIRQIRKIDYHIPIIILTSFDDKNILLNAANLAIDGYLIKPVEFTLLVEKLLQAMKRAHSSPNLITFNKNLVFNSDTKEFYYHNAIQTLGNKELELVEFLLENHQKAFSKEVIEAKLWNYEVQCSSAVKNLVLRVRKKLGNIITSIRGVGYRINLDEEFIKK